MKPLRKLYFGLLYILPAVLFFSYYPVIRLGSNSSMNFELSLPLIWLVIFDIIAFVGMVFCSRLSFNRKLKVVTQKALKRPSATNGERNERSSARNDGSEQACRVGLFGLQYRGISDRKFFLFALFPLYATLSIFWSSNHTRAILTAGIIWLLFFAIFAIVYLSPLFGLPSKFRPTLIKAFFISSIIICVVCWGQCILDVCGIAREHTLLCVGCVSQTFGFPHPSGFAIEPQFMGNLLLAPTLLSLWILTKPKMRVTPLRDFSFLIFLHSFPYLFSWRNLRFRNCFSHFTHFYHYPTQVSPRVNLYTSYRLYFYAYSSGNFLCCWSYARNFCLWRY